MPQMSGEQHKLGKQESLGLEHTWDTQMPKVILTDSNVVQSLIMSNSLQPHGLQHARLPCPSLSPRVCSNSCPLSQWRHPTISSSVALFSFCLQSFSASGAFPMRWIHHKKYITFFPNEWCVRDAGYPWWPRVREERWDHEWKHVFWVRGDLGLSLSSASWSLLLLCFKTFIHRGKIGHWWGKLIQLTQCLTLGKFPGDAS